jgi:hypothetical protein
MLNNHSDVPLSAIREKKLVTLSETAIQEIEDFSKQHNLTFSKAVEVLVLMGLNKKGLEIIVLATFLRDVVRKESAQHYNRFAKLIAHAGLEAGAAKEAAQQLYFLRLVELSKSGKFEQAVGVNPESPEGKKIIGFYSKKKQDFRWRSVQFLKKKLLELTEILEEVSG